jgi:hypothetical protein
MLKIDATDEDEETRDLGLQQWTNDLVRIN